ncbi:MAG: hydantoinase/oxoprolinase family protein [Solirubrobacteraceae bacterium]
MGHRIAVDTGGTFTDVVITTDRGELWVGKAPTTRERIWGGLGDALTHVAGEHDLTLAALLAATDVFIYGTTRSTNAILTGGVAKTAFLTTAGHPDTLVLREGGKLNPFDFRQSYPEPYVPRRRTFEVPERIGSEGEVVDPLDEDAVRETLRGLPALGVEAIAVCLLWSIANPAHERRVGELIAEELPGLPFTLSHELNPIIREYRRASSAAIDASLKPLMQRHLGEMAADLTAAGFDGQLLVVTSFGGVMTVADVQDRPIYSVNSAPSMAPIAGRTYAPGEGSVIVCDMGGTSFDVSVVRDGQVKFTRETWLGEPFTGHMTGLSSVDIKNIGAGGGSIAWIDSGGLLRIGPQSAGAVPGPAAYGLGGTEPTVSDASIVLGHLDPETFLGGRLALDPARAREAIERVIAGPLGMTVEDAAWAILTVANERMVTAIRDITINEGLDPRGGVLVAGGGAGGMTIGRIAETLGSERVLVPRTAGALSACGGLFSDIVSEFSISLRADTGRFDAAAVNAGLAGLDAQMDAFFDGLGTPPEQRGKEFIVEARYPFQVWELDVPLAGGRFDSSADVDALVEGFHDVHERVFAVRESGQQVECISWKGRATANLPKPTLPTRPPASGPPVPRTTAAGWFGGDTSRPTPRYVGDTLAPGHVVEGPAVIEEPTTTVVVLPGWQAAVTTAGEYLLTRADPGDVAAAAQTETVVAA